MKLHVLAASLAALTLTAGIATAQTKPAAPATPAAKPAAPAAAPVVDKTHASYAFGWSLGQDLQNSGEPVDIATVIRGLQDAYGKKTPAYTEQQLGAAYSGFQQRVQQKMEAQFRKALDDNKAQSANFITQYKAQEGVITLPSGIMYRIAKPGTGAKATANSQVQIGFRSFLAAVGVPLSGVQTPPAFKVSDAPIPALKETLPLMQQGAVWEVVVPPGKGAGDQNQQFAQQAIAIQVELGSVK
ncbi:MAG TPA: FKBP-type peptidyl-prolyl cis-trans isomerase N-terminal domain-containing protein [Thermomonas sp.]|jgi:FKBP-type peptidyl-prolyl cis-trans isomerase|uniref:FKBP-type peptidyl-prolyl cis-trans isomerase N-terminal domain-containing protein n=1 Tax=Thermomonas sp. TaxID=1971895 RepID=UPI002BA44581|nr:FKBP-type peptidyl-prolyl cis-trans isomerase N-terminal domain-containing protein [Thermomonas sp.]HOU66915.1 FKBP-type peptidyl-prolyl cis-trans isomerase N-terminal domain-containing protein [Thermomonas sp.]HOZ23373.1 FKBP-type peptidyl-prolyl cis-trans isomerase N-terminal domain-containing protein [Thermomonas sp.]HPM57460.1 FKBP-type peptidyl-prolyl cis-trans isomerase N-terminal domain-containing protein [Thermomonas sp.]HPW12802.1 FKBP-type peptidyl-prolyl cis-trans isomerase N-term